MMQVTQAALGKVGRPLFVMLALLLGACAGLPQRPALAPEMALQDTGDTALARGMAPKLAAHPGQSAFYPLLSGTDALAYSTFLGGGAAEIGYAVAVDRAGAIYVTGVTGSDDFPMAGN